MIVISWIGLTQYGARCIGAFVETCGEPVKVVQIPADRFAEGDLKHLTHCDVIDIKEDDPRTLHEVVGGEPDVFVLAGWTCSAMLRWARQVKARGGHVILGTDEAFVDRSWRQFLRKWRFLLRFATWVDRVFVCGAGGLKQFVDYYGLSSQKVFTGCYASDPGIFFNGPALKERAKRFIFVGKFDENKNVLPICRVFCKIHARHSDWEFEVCGNGPLSSALGDLAGVSGWDAKVPVRGNGLVLTGFVNNAELGEKYRAARCFVLGSFSEKWGVVVHEAAASGCCLMLSTHVGSHYDFAREDNASLFEPGSEQEIEAAFEKIISLDEVRMVKAQETSVSCAERFSPHVYATQLSRVVATLRTDS